MIQSRPKKPRPSSRSIKWYLWNGNVRETLFRAEWVAEDLDTLDSDYPSMKRFARVADEFRTYIANNADAIPNYAERWRYGERVSTAFVESTVNLVVGKRFAKRQQMQWTPRGAHLLLQTRTRTLDGTLRGTFASGTPTSLPTTRMARHSPWQPDAPSTVWCSPSSRWSNDRVTGRSERSRVAPGPRWWSISLPSRPNEFKTEVDVAATHLMSDAWSTFVAVGQSFAAHDTVQHARREYARGTVHANSVEGFNSRVRRTVAGVFHHISPEHADRLPRDRLPVVTARRRRPDHPLGRPADGERVRPLWTASACNATRCGPQNRRRPPTPPNPQRQHLDQIVNRCVLFIVGIPFAPPDLADTVDGWRSESIRWRALTTQAPSRSWTSGFGVRLPAAPISAGSAGRGAFAAHTVELSASRGKWPVAGCGAGHVAGRPR